MPAAVSVAGTVAPVAVALALVACSSNSLSLVGPSGFDPRGFTVAVIPDTQCYTSGGGDDQPAACGEPRAQVTNEMFFAQARFIAANRGASRIVAAVGVGDIVNCGHNVASWESARNAYDVIDVSGMPYVAAIGNHDYDGWCNAGLSSRSAINYNAYFGFERFGGKPWYGDHFPTSSNENSYIRFEADGESYVVLTLEYLPPDAALAWAGQVIEANRTSWIVVVVHSHLDSTGAQRGSTAGSDGAGVWSKLLRNHANIMVVLSGHDMASRRVDTGNAGNLVPQLQSNFQFDEAGGNGYMRLLHVIPEARQIQATTYSPYLRRMRTDPANQFVVEYGMPLSGQRGRSMFQGVH